MGISLFTHTLILYSQKLKTKKCKMKWVLSMFRVGVANKLFVQSFATYLLTNEATSQDLDEFLKLSRSVESFALRF